MTTRWFSLAAASASLILALAQKTSAVSATGGAITETNGYRIHTFTNSAAATSLVVTADGNVEVLVVAGGGGGGNCIGGGGGAGGLIYTSSYAIISGSIPVTVGAGGAGGIAAAENGGFNGSNSVFGALISYGGGGGAGWSAIPAKKGGSGGGGQAGQSGALGTNGQGKAGGNGGPTLNYFPAGGGGGAGAPGGSPVANTYPSGNGGTGLQYSISGVATYYAGGGGGGSYVSGPSGTGGAGGGGNGGIAGGNNPGFPGTNGTGGGGGAGAYNSAYTAGGNGGSGIVIVRYIAGSPLVSNTSALVTGSSVTLSGYLVSTGMDGNVSAAVFWGTNDAANSMASWTYTNRFPGWSAVGPLSTNVTLGSPGGTRHYYRFFASNSWGSAWAESSGSFSSTGAPGVNNAGGPVNIGAFSATLQGEVTGGNPTPEVWIYWGATNQGATKSWEHQIPVGPASNWTFSATPNGMSPGRTYYYTCYASNIYGDAWSAVTNFTSLGGASRTWDGGGVNGNASNPTNWVGNLSPGPGDAIILDATTNKNMTWDLNFPVASWTQAGYTGTVTVAPGGGGTNLTILGDCVISNGAWQFTAGQPCSLAVNGNLYVGSTIYCQYSSLTGNGTGRTFTVGGNLILATGGTINAIGLGFPAGQGPGRQNGSGGGGGHGGMGGNWANGSAGGGGGLCYGSIQYPIGLGSGGNNAGGGGAIRLNVTGTATVDGAIIVNGAPCGADRAGGAGGAVWITADSILGGGSIDARGSAPTTPASSFGSGGGGRIAINYNSTLALPVTNICAAAGKSPNSLNYGADGGAGTVFIKKAADTFGTMIVDNSNVVTWAGTWPWPTTLLSTNVMDIPNGNFLIRNLGVLEVVSNITLSVAGYWTNSGNFIAGTGSTVMFITTNQAAIAGGNTFYHLTCTNGGKLLVFEGRNTNTVQGLLTLQGQPGNLLTLRSSDTNVWYLKVVSGVLNHPVQYVDVARSYANGITISAYNSTDSGTNVNWAFATAGQTNTWIGTTSTNWITAANWDMGRVPAQLDYVIISNPCAYYPTLDYDKTLSRLRINAGALLRLAGRNLVVLSNVTVQGTLAAAGTEILTFNGNLDFTGGVFTNASSTCVLGGTTPQTVTSSGNRFYALNIANTSALVRFTDAVVATNIAVSAGVAQFAGALTAQAYLTNQAGTLSFAGPVSAPTFASYSGNLTFSNTLTANRYVNSWGNTVFKDSAAVGNFHAYGRGTNTFNQSKLYAVTNLWLNGASTGAWQVLRSSSDGNAWNLRVARMSSVVYVDVKDSDASSGLTIEPIFSSNSQGNVNWVFDRTTNWAHWVGGTNSSFTNAANWLPPGAPGPGSLLFIDGNYTNAPRLTNTLTVSNLVIGGEQTATLTLDAPLTVLGDVKVMPNGILTHTLNNTQLVYSLSLTVGGALQVMPDGQINVEGKGYAANKGPGAGLGQQGAGGHGGEGGYWDNYPYYGGTCYGSVTQPVTLGSGGGSGSGGGAIRINVAGTTKVAGVISASGANPGASAAGAGGSVWLTTDTLEGDGGIEAEGGRGGVTVGYSHGGGGRIAVYLGSGNDFGNVAISAASKVGVSSGSAGGAGTVYLKQASQVYGTCILDNKGEAKSTRTIITTNVTDKAVGDFIFRNASKLLVQTGQSFTVYGIWSNGATFSADTNATVFLAGTNTAAIYGSNSFCIFSATTPGKILAFQAGRTNWVNQYLELRRVTVGSTSTGAWSYLRLAVGASQDVQRVTVRDSNATNGQTIVATKSVDLGHNVNWNIIAMPSGTVLILR